MFSLRMREETDSPEEELDDQEVDELLGDEDVDLDRVYHDIESAKKRAARKGEPAWRVLEQRREKALMREQISDLDDYDIEDLEVELDARARAAAGDDDFLEQLPPLAAEG